jgi:hypothetical protein
MSSTMSVIVGPFPPPPSPSPLPDAPHPSMPSCGLSLPGQYRIHHVLDPGLDTGINHVSNYGYSARTAQQYPTNLYCLCRNPGQYYQASCIALRAILRVEICTATDTYRSEQRVSWPGSAPPTPELPVHVLQDIHIPPGGDWPPPTEGPMASMGPILHLSSRTSPGEMFRSSKEA